MDLEYRPDGTGRVMRWLATLSGALVVLTLAAGCAANKPPVVQAPVVGAPPVVEQIAVSRLSDGQTGFVITETLEPAAPWRNDFERAVVLLQDTRYAEAVPLLEEIVRKSPGVTAPHINLAEAYRHTKQYEQAEAQLQMALQLVPDHPVANNEYGLMLRETGHFKEAREVYESTLQAFPEYLPIRRNLGVLCEIYLGDLDCALEQYTIYSEADPGNQVMPLWIADLNLRMGRN